MSGRRLIILFIVFAVFAQVLGFDYLTWDDTGHVYLNPGIIEPSFAHLVEFWIKPYFGLYMPVTYSFWWATAWISTLITGTTLNPHFFHALNLLVHLLNTLLVFEILKLWLGQMGNGKRDSWAPAVGALLFGIHPVQVESVAWVSEFKGVLATFFALLCIRYMFLAYRQRGEKSNASRAFKEYYLLSFGFFLLSILAKPSTASLPAILLLVHNKILRRPLSEGAKELLPWALIVFPLMLITRHAQPAMVGEWIPPLILRPVVALDALSFYLYKIILPINLALDYTRTPALVVETRQIYFTWLPFTALFIWSWYKRARFPILYFSLIFLSVVIAPVSGIVPFIFQKHSTSADHYLYFALLGISFLVAAVFERIPGARWPIGLALAAGIICTLNYLPDWENSGRLFAHVAQISPRSYAALTEVGLDFEQRKDPTTAMKYYHEALLIKPNYLPALNNVGLMLMQSGRFQEAATHYEEFIRLQPSAPIAYANLGLALVQLNRRDEGEKYLLKALQLEPRNANINYNYGLFKNSSGQSEEAIKFLEVARTEAPGDSRIPSALVNAHKRAAEALLKSGRRHDAIAHLQDALKVEPGNAEVSELLKSSQNSP